MAAHAALLYRLFLCSELKRLVTVLHGDSRGAEWQGSLGEKKTLTLSLSLYPPTHPTRSHGDER